MHSACASQSHNLIVDVMLKEMDDIQFTTMLFSNGSHKFSEHQIIDVSVMKLKSTGGSRQLRNEAQTPLPNNLGRSSMKSFKLNTKSSYMVASPSKLLSAESKALPLPPWIPLIMSTSHPLLISSSD